MQQFDRVNGRIAQGDAARGIGIGVISPTVALLRFGVGFDDNGFVGVVFLRPLQHFTKCIRIGAARGHRGIAAGLVDHQHIAGVGQGGIGVVVVIFA